MPGQLNTDPLDDGVVGSTTASARNGILGTNSGTDPYVPDTVAGGTGVRGTSSVPGGAGVAGEQTSSFGSGVLGRGGRSGVSGYHAERVGVLGAATTGNGVHGVAEGQSPFVEALTGVALESKALKKLLEKQREAAGGGPLGKDDHVEASNRFIDTIPGSIPSWVGRDTGGGLGIEISSPWLDDIELVVTEPRGPQGNGVWGHTKAPHGNGVLGTVEAGTEDAAAISGVGDLAGRFIGAVDVMGAMLVAGAVRIEGGTQVDGDVTAGGTLRAPRLEVTTIAAAGDIEVAGDIRLLGADLAEGFAAGESGMAPGSVLVMDDDGRLCAATTAYDSRVVGVVSGAGEFRPAVLLDQANAGGERKVPVALVGKVSCWVDADAAPIRVGDLLTTSDVPGHAMRADDRERSFGAVLGKAMQPLARGRALLRVLVALQ